MSMSFKLLAVVLTVGASSLAAPANAAPITAPASLQNAAMSSVESVQWRRGWRGRAWGPGIAAGLIVGGAIAASQPWGGYGYAAPGYAYTPGPGYATGYGEGNDVAYCQQRFRSYDPSTGTYLGYDGLRHPCP